MKRKIAGILVPSVEFPCCDEEVEEKLEAAEKEKKNKPVDDVS